VWEPVLEWLVQMLGKPGTIGVAVVP
jgi:hypothetical protein